MTAAPQAFRPESARNPDGIRPEGVPDSALSKQASQPASKEPPPLGTEPQSGRVATIHARISQIDPWDALTRVLSLLRPDWRPEAIRGALLDDKRPPRDVVAAAVACALDPDTRHPAAIAHRTTGSATPTPPNLRRDDLCPVHLDDAATCRGCAADRKATKEAP